MQAPIKITHNPDGSKATDGRGLHEFLQSKQQFADWMKSRIKKYGFVENVDYTPFHKIMKRETGATTVTEYALSLDMAKEIAMVEANGRGREARQYFIEVEKMARSIQPGNRHAARQRTHQAPGAT